MTAKNSKLDKIKKRLNELKQDHEGVLEKINKFKAPDIHIEKHKQFHYGAKKIIDEMLELVNDK